MNLKTNRKGFTMVELLAAIAIMGILATIAIVSVSSVLDNAEEKHYETQEKNMIMAAQSYAQDNRNILPKAVGDTRTITLQELQKAKYIGKVVDRSKKNCDEGSVTIFKYSKDGYSYRMHLVCPSKEIGSEEEDVAGPVIILKNDQTDNNYQNPYFTYEIKENSENDGKIISYSYQVYNNGVLVRDTGNVPVSKAKELPQKKVSLKELVPGRLTIVFTAVNHYGGKTTQKILNRDYQDPNGPECGEVLPKREVWENISEVNLTIKCIDTKGSGCARELFTQRFTEDSRTNIIEISNKAGNKTPCVVGTYIDKKGPTTPTIVNTYENTWINKSYSVKVTASDETSGVAYYQYRYPDSVIASEREWVTYESSKRTYDESVAGNYTYTTTAFSKERSEYVEIRACDQAHNCSAPAKSMIKIDKTAPTCNISRNIATPNGDNSWYKTDVVITMTKTDPKGSDQTAVVSPLYYALTKNTTASYSATPITNDLTATQTNTAAAGVVWRGYIKDEAGNTATCSDANLKIDTNAPTCSVGFSGTTGDNGWYKTKNVTVSLTKNDTGNSTMASFDLTTSSSASYSGKSSGTQTNTAGTTWYGYVKDKAGNTGECSASVKVDTEVPTCSVNFSGTKGDNNWYKTNVNVSLTKADTGTSAMNSFDLTKSSSPTYSGKTSGTQANTASTTWYGYVKDNAGNVGKCNASVKVDTSAPTCTVNFSGTKGDNGWYKGKNVSVSLTKSDPGNSTMASFDLTTSSSASYNGKSSGTQTNTTGTTWYGYVKDKAGNTGKCSASVKVDTEVPTCSVSFSGTKGDNNWYKTNASVSLTKADTGTSAMNSFDLTTSSSPTYNGKTSGTQANTASTTWYGYVKDNAGNVGKCSNSVKVDTSAPTCTVNFSGTTGDNGWYKGKNVSVSLTKSDPGNSTMASFDLTTSSSASYNGKSSGTQTNTTGTTWYGYVKDKAGNTGKCSASVKVDTEVPTCSVSFSGTKGDNNWYKTNASVSLTKADTGTSAMNSFDLTTSSSPTYNGKTSGTQANTASTTWYGYVKDNAGNVGKCSKSVKVDTSAPTCTVSFSGTAGDNGWYKISNVSVSLTKSDPGNSTMASFDLTTSSSASYNGKSSGTQANTTGTTWYGYVKDKAGNTGKCSASVKVDTSAPTCALKKSGTWNSAGYYTSNVTVSFDTKTDTGGSNMASYGLASSSSVNYNSNTSATQGASNGITWYGFVKDNAGNTGTCNTGSFKVLLEPPKITFSLSGSTSTAKCVDGNTGELIKNFTKTITKDDLKHEVTCENAAGQKTTASKTYTATYTCTSSSHVCDTCHGSNCGGCCGTGGSYCAYDCNCRDECSGGYYSFS